MIKKYKTLALCMALATVMGGISPNTALAAQSISAFEIGPGLNNLSLGDEFALYQWGLKNDGQFQMLERKLDLPTIDLNGTAGSDGRETIFLPPLAPGSFKITSTLAKPGIDINIQPAWELYRQAENKRPVTVAVIDTGIDTSHPDLAKSLWVNTGEIPGDGIDNDGNGYIDDVNGWNFIDNNNILYSDQYDSHGTHAAGTIAASRENGGIAGISDNNYVKIMTLKVLGGEEGRGTPEAVAAAIRYAEANGAQICNLSFGSDGYTEELVDVMKASNMLFVVAAGNGDDWNIGYNIDQYPVYPASFPYDNILTVGNLMFDGTLDQSSNYGSLSVDIAAPGTYILSTIPDASYAFMSGTSMAAPMVTGVAAMVYSSRPELSVIDVKNILISSARKMEPLRGKVVSEGMVDAGAAMEWMG